MPTLLDSSNTGSPNPHHNSDKDQRFFQFHPLSVSSFSPDSREHRFLSNIEKAEPPIQQTWQQSQYPQLRRYPACKAIAVQKLLGQGEEGYIFEVNINGAGPYVLKVFKQVKRPCDPQRWPFSLECRYYARAEAVRAGAVQGRASPRGPPPEPYTEHEMLKFLNSFCSDGRNQQGDLKLRARTRSVTRKLDDDIYNILLGMDGSLGWMRLECHSVNLILQKWDLDICGAMDGQYFQEHPFAIVKKLVEPNEPLDRSILLKWIDLAQYMGFELYTFDKRNWKFPGILIDAADVLTMPFDGNWKHAALLYKHFRERYEQDAKC